MKRFLAVALLAHTVAGTVIFTQGGGFNTTVAIVGTRFHVNGHPTYGGSAAEGRLLNSRMINVAFDDSNAATRSQWAYPDTGVWDAERNISQFVAAVPTYAAYGLTAITIGMQGGNPVLSTSEPPPWHVSAFRADGTLRAAWLSRLDRAIRACDAYGIVVILNYFYFGQDQVLLDEAAVIQATDNATDWVLAQGYTNVLIEISNEADSVYEHPILGTDRVHELIQRVQQRSNGRLKVSSSLSGGGIPGDPLLAASDFVLLHGNGQTATSIRNMVDTVRSRSAYQAKPKPIVFNEDSITLANFDAAVEKQAGWGYHDKSGFQVVPIDWSLNTFSKQAFFERVAGYATSSSSGVNQAPQAADQSVATSPGTATTITLAYTDPDGPEPYTFNVLTPALNGILSSGPSNGHGRVHARGRVHGDRQLQLAGPRRLAGVCHRHRQRPGAKRHHPKRPDPAGG